jgi:predicted enzyme related to lactoylglutathione lyase
MTLVSTSRSRRRLVSRDLAERTKYSPGTFSWTDLATTDQDAAKQFYADLFGWHAVDNPVGDGTTYSMMDIDGKPVAGIGPQPEQLRAAGAPPTWKVEAFEGMQMPYLGITTSAGNSNGGIRAATENEPPYWLVYFGSDDADADLARASELGASKLVEVTDIGVGKIGVAQDPQGAVFAFYAGRFDA